MALIFNMQRILITGSSGYLGSQLVKCFCDLGYHVIGGIRKNSNLWRLGGYEKKIQIANLDDPRHIEGILRKTKIDFIIHTACAYGRTKGTEIEVFKANIELPIRLAEIARKQEGTVFINTDTFFAKPEFEIGYMGAYVLSKRHSWEWLQLYKKEIKLINMRLEHVYGPSDDHSKFVSWLCNIAQGEGDEPNEVVLSSCSQLRDFVYIDDVVSAFVKTVREVNFVNSGDIFEVGTGKAIPVRSLVEHIQMSAIKNGKSGIKPRFDSSKDRTGEIVKSTANTSALKGLGWRPMVPLSEGIERLFRAELNDKK
ncbi:MAG: NAD-dependent epimerase/dehydratase [Pseudoalteromonas distincta]